jgi:hypothetical protein
MADTADSRKPRFATHGHTIRFTLMPPANPLR